MSLYTISSEMEAVMAAFSRLPDAESDRADPEAAEAMMQHVDALAEAFDAKAEDYACLIRICETRAEARRAEGQRMMRLADADEGLAERLRDALMEAMQRIDRPKVNTARFALSVVAHGGKRPVQVVDEAALPAEYVVPTYGTRIDRDALREALERGESVPGAVLADRGKRLNIR